MKRNSSIIFVSVMVALVAALGVFQYFWLDQLSEGERNRMKSRLESDARRFADDFNREIQAAFFNLQLPASTWEKRDWGEFSDRFEFWRSRAPYPDLIKRIHFIDAKNKVDMRFAPEQRTFVEAKLPAEIEGLKALVGDTSKIPAVSGTIPALLMPIHEDPLNLKRIIFTSAPSSNASPFEENFPHRAGLLVIELDRDVIRDRIFKDLETKYFSENGGEFELAFVDKERRPVIGQASFDKFDAKADLLTLSPESFIFFSNRESIPRESGVRRSVVLSSTTKTIDTRGVGTISTTKSGSNSNVDLHVVTDRLEPAITERVTSISAESHADWFLNVRHRSGSIDEHIAALRLRNMAIGFGILGLIGTSVMFIFVSAQRARSFAQKQVDFVSSVSHEFRTPLAVIYSASENLADGVASGPDQVTRYGELIKNEGRKLSAMVEQILEFAGARSGKRRFDFRPSDAAEIVSDAISECGPLLKEKEFDVETWIEPELPTINADRVALSQAVQNLIVNAVKYSNGSKWVRIELQRWSEGVEISVIDRGIGIGQMDLKQIFEPFYRAGVVVDEQIHGNGLGLSLVRETVAAHGGKIDVESRVGEGSRFTIRIPV